MDVGDVTLPGNELTVADFDRAALPLTRAHTSVLFVYLPTRLRPSPRDYLPHPTTAGQGYASNPCRFFRLSERILRDASVIATVAAAAAAAVVAVAAAAAAAVMLGSLRYRSTRDRLGSALPCTARTALHRTVLYRVAPRRAAPHRTVGRIASNRVVVVVVS